MHHLIFGHSFAGLVAPILLFGLAFHFLNKKRTSVRRNAEDAITCASDLLTVSTETNSGGSSLSLTETNGASNSSAMATGNRYEVFLSFRGSDTRKGFTDHLYTRLVDAGIHAFKDDNELRHGKKIGPDLLAAIKNSKILIPIISSNYGSSRWCLNELVQIMECQNSNIGHLVLPIFYKVEPTHVRRQIGSFGDVFRMHERHSDQAILEKWKLALSEVSFLKGWEANGYEGKLVKSVVQKVLNELKKEFELVIPDNLVGIDSHVKNVMEFLDNNSSATLFVGIHGMGGIDDDDQLKALAGNHNWFSPGSRILITTRNKAILDNAAVDFNYEHEEMDGDQSLILFSRHAFRSNSPPSEFKDLAHEVVSTTGGLPLSLEVLGSLLCGKRPTQWRGTIKKLKKVPNRKVLEKLRISYDVLENGQKKYFWISLVFHWHRRKNCILHVGCL
ncbi:disease resistance protein RPV1-like [Eucalyptus grandis]|uniref:disease resistance protein RPV1-like n=1 Tax=Eucalyptus grandis TaxID=71139 RepID=UPI00192E8CA7|nr:disease resistance protein RPV1-like [Eucalyptus grandis]